MLGTIPGDQHGVVGQSLDRALGQGLHDRGDGELAGLLVDDVEDFIHREACRVRQGPAGQLLRHGIHEPHPGFGIGGDDRIPDGVERDGQLLLAFLQGHDGLL